MATAGTLTIDLAANVARLASDMSEAKRSVNDAMRSIDSVVGFAKTAFIGLGATVSVLSFAGLIRQQIELGDQFSKMSEKLGISVENLSAYNYAAKLSGVSSEELQGALSKLGRSVSEALGDPTSKAAEALRNLGLSANDLRNKNLSQIFEEVGPKLANISNESVRIQYQMTLLGKSGYELQPLLANIGKLKDEAISTGNVMSGKFAKDAEAFNDSVDRLSSSIGTMARHIASAVVPVLDALVQRFNVMIGAQKELTGDLLEKEMRGHERRLEFLNKQLEAQKASGLIPTGVVFEIANTEKQIALLKEKIALQNSSASASGATVSAGPTNVSALGASDAAQKEVEKQQKLWNAQVSGEAMRLNSLDQFLMTEDERMRASYQKREADLLASLQLGLLTTEEYEQRETALKQRYTEERENSLYGIRKRYNSMNLESAGAFFGFMAQMMQSKNKRLFQIGKAFAIAETIIDTHRAAMGAYAALAKIPIIGPALGVAAAAAAIVAGAARIQAIRSSEPGGGGAVGTFSANPNTGVPSEPVSSGFGVQDTNGQAISKQREINVTLVGDAFSPEGVRSLIDKINEQQGYGANIRVMQA